MSKSANWLFQRAAYCWSLDTPVVSLSQSPSCEKREISPQKLATVVADIRAPTAPTPPPPTNLYASFLVNHWLTISSIAPAARWRQRSKAAARRLMSCRAPAAPVHIKTRAPSGGVWTLRSSIRFKSAVPLADTESSRDGQKPHRVRN